MTCEGKMQRKDEQLKSCGQRHAGHKQDERRRKAQGEEEQGGEEASRQHKDTGAEVHGRRRGRQEGGNYPDVGRK